MSKSYNSLREDLIKTADDKEYRHTYAEESLNLSVATQIKVLREQREMTQGTLAEQAEMTQSMISRYENVNYSAWSLSTLRKLAKALDVYLEVRFRSFRDMVESVDNFNREALKVPKFTEDPYFKPVQPATQAQLNVTLASATGTARGTATVMGRGAYAICAQQPKSLTDVGSATSAANTYSIRDRMTGTMTG